jgi:hypothetical protein
MIILHQSGLSNFVCTLNEKATLSANTAYLFSLKNDESNEITVFCATDVSLFPPVFNEFNVIITGKTEQNIYNSIVYLPVGHYVYSVFENPTITGITTTNLNLVERGKLIVSATTTTTL